MNRKTLTTLTCGLLIALFSIVAVQAQTVFDSFPKDNQLYPRDINTNVSEIQIKGKVATNFAEGIRIVPPIIEPLTANI